MLVSMHPRNLWNSGIAGLEVHVEAGVWQLAQWPEEFSIDSACRIEVSGAYHSLLAVDLRFRNVY